MLIVTMYATLGRKLILIVLSSFSFISFAKDLCVDLLVLLISRGLRISLF